MDSIVWNKYNGWLIYWTVVHSILTRMSNIWRSFISFLFHQFPSHSGFGVALLLRPLKKFWFIDWLSDHFLPLPQADPHGVSKGRISRHPILSSSSTPSIFVHFRRLLSSHLSTLLSRP